MEPAEAAIARAYYALLHADREAGRTSSVADYQRRFPGYEDLVARLHREVEPGSADTPGDPGEEALEPDPIPEIGPYRVIKEIGRGAQGDVYLAEDTRLRRHVALKVLRGWGGDVRERLARFQREAQVASRLDHPGICTVYETGVARGVPYIAMRHVEGRGLGRVLGGAARPAAALVAERLDLVEKLARAVNAAHDAGVVHRDLKPGNVIVTPDGQPVVLDFGLARDLEHAGGSLTM